MPPRPHRLNNCPMGAGKTAIGRRAADGTAAPAARSRLLLVRPLPARAAHSGLLHVHVRSELRQPRAALASSGEAQDLARAECPARRVWRRFESHPLRRRICLPCTQRDCRFQWDRVKGGGLPAGRALKVMAREESEP